MNDPSPRTDGRCAVCRQPRGRTIPKTLSKTGQANLRANLAHDPFCSAACCRSWHSVDISEGEHAAQQRRDLEHDTGLA